MYCLTKKNILVLCIILHSVNQALSIQCYFCMSTFDKNCEKNPKGTAVVECADSELLAPIKGCDRVIDFHPRRGITFLRTKKGYGQCLKLVRDLDPRFPKEKRVVARVCGSHLDSDLTIQSFYGDFIVHRCNADLCNSSSSFRNGYWSIASSLLLSMFLILFSH